MDEHNCTPQEVVNTVLDRPIVWTDLESMPLEVRRRWGADARAILTNPVFISLVGRSGLIFDTATSGEMAKNLVEHIARYAKSFEEVRDLRMTINGIELIRKELERALFEEKKPTEEEPNAPI